MGSSATADQLAKHGEGGMERAMLNQDGSDGRNDNNNLVNDTNLTSFANAVKSNSKQNH